jgi:hypothetical protein
MKVQNSKYNAGKVDASVTTLIQPARVAVLRGANFEEIVRDVSEEFWALLGSGIHHLLELGATENMIVEERLFMTIDEFRISGQLDMQEYNGDVVDITDYKVTSTFSVTGLGDVKPEWEQQLNLQAMLLTANRPDKKVGSLKITAILRDWTQSQSKRDPNYPQSPIVNVPIPLWTHEEQIAFARSRIQSHAAARFAFNMDEEMELCSNEDRWVRDETWAVKKKGGKRAVRSFDNLEEAEDLLKEKGEGYSVEYRPGTSIRCDYCGVQKWCSQYRDIISKEDASNDRHDSELPSSEAGSQDGTGNA